MASFRSRVFLLGLGLLLLMTIQIFRAHIDKGSMFLTSEEMVGSISEKDTSSENILKHSSVYHKRHSFVKPSVQEKEFSKGKKSSSSSLKNTDTPSASDSETYSQSSLVHEAKKNNTANISYSKQKDLALLYSSKDRFPKEPHDSDGVKKSKKESVEIVSYHSNRSRKSPLINETLRNSFKALLPKHQPEDLHTEGRTETYQNSLWIHPGELGTDFNYYNISLRSVREIADNITIDISRYMTGYPIGHAPVLLHNPDLCDVSFLEEYHRDMHHGLFLLVIIPSLPRHTEIRSIIRETWASAAYNGGFWAGREMAETVRLMFVFGGSEYSDDDKALLYREAKTYKDILVMDFVDSYQNLSIKITNALRWSGKYCSDVRHLMKVDEDTYVHLPQLVTLLKHVEKRKERFVLGRQHKHVYPKVVRKGRWRVGIEYPLPYYPRYIYGHSYIVSGSALKPMLQVLNRIPGVKNEDAFITGIVAKLNNISRLHSRAFAGPSYEQVLCNITKGYYVSLTYCCKEHLRTLYKHAVEGRCDKTKFKYIPTRHCRFFRHHHNDHHNDTVVRKPNINTKNLELLLNASSALIERMENLYFRDEEDDSVIEKNEEEEQ